MKVVMFLLAVSATSCSRPAPPVGRTRLPDNAKDLHPPARLAPGPANLSLTCTSAAPRCDKPGFRMSVLGDLVHSCATQPDPDGRRSVRLEITSSNDPDDGILVAFDGYDGPRDYALDDPDRRFVRVSDGVDRAQCTGGPIHGGAQVTAADPNCGSPACSLDVRDDAPGDPFPKTLTFYVSCTSVCQNGSDVSCGAVVFTTRADCT